MVLTQGMINNKTMELARIDERTTLGATEIWQVENLVALFGDYTEGRFGRREFEARAARLVVDGKWMTDPNNKYVETNEYGELNNVVEVD